MSPEKSSTLSFRDSSNNYTTSLRRLIPYLLGALGIILMIVGFLFKDIKYSPSSISPTVIPVSSVSGEVKMIKVDISGAVEKPNVYEIPYDSRVQDVLITAGGLSPKADRNYLSKSINLAQRLTDGMKIYIPYIGETTANSIPVNSFNKLININTASESELDTLPGIGQVTAQKIISGRPYNQIEDLNTKKIISQSVWLKIKDLIRIN